MLTLALRSFALLPLAVLLAPNAAAQTVQPTYIKASNSRDGDFFGGVLAMSGDTSVVEARLEWSGATGVDGDQAADVEINFEP